MMKKNDFNKLIKDYKENLKKVIYMHINGNIYLTSRQLNEVIKKRDEMKVKCYK